MDIPKVCSAPLDLTAPSFLTLPAEIRNRICELVFVQSEPILIHNADYYYNRGLYGPDTKSNTSFDERARHSDGMEYDYQSKNKRYDKARKRWEMRLDTEKEDEQLFRHEASLGIGLLKSCRQIYHETASILYSENTFVVSRVRYIYDSSAITACERKECRDYHQLCYAPIWLASLGSQMKRIKKVVIDISAVCDHRHASGTTVLTKTAYGDDFHLLPLLRIIWNGHLSRCEITFAHTGRRTGGGPWAKTPQMLRATATRLNRALVSFTKDDTLERRCLSASRSFLSSLSMRSNGTGGSVQYYTAPRSIVRDFGIDQASGKVTWYTAKPITSLTDLPLQAQDMICRHVFTHEQSLRVMVNSSNPLSCDRSVFDVSRTFRKCFTRAVRACIPVTIELEAAEADTDYNALDPLRRFSLDTEASRSRRSRWTGFSPCDRLPPYDGLISQIINESIEIPRDEEQQTTKTTLLVRISLARSTQPTDVRINTNDLLYWLGTVGHKSIKNKVFLTIQLEYSEGRKLHCDTNTIAIGKLKMGVFLYLTDMLDQHPRGGDGGPERPDLWIDGHANLVDLSSLSTGFRFNHTNLTKSGVGERNIRSVLEDIEARHDIGDGTDCAMYGSNPCACNAWKSLRPWAESVWKNEQSHRGKNEQVCD